MVGEVEGYGPNIKIPFLKTEAGGVFLYDRPFCASCSDSLIEIDGKAEYVVKEEYMGKITDRERDFIEEEQEEHRAVSIFLEHCEN